MTISKKLIQVYRSIAYSAFLFIVCLLLFVQNTSGQKNYVPGSLTFANGDTAKGYIDYRHWSKSPENITFKKTIDGAETTYSPMDLISFAVAGEKYYSAITQVDAGNVNNNSDNRELITKTDTIFLLTVIEGEKSLFCYRNNQAKEYFYIKTPSGFEILEYKTYMSDYQGYDAMRENKKYTGQLMSYLNDCESIPAQLQRLNYKYTELVKLFNSYNECKGIKPEVQAKKKKVVAEFGLLAGISMADLNFSGSQYPMFEHQEYKPSLNFSGGLFSNIILVKNKKLALENDLILSSYKLSDSYTNDETIQKTFSTDLKYNYLKLHTLVNFRIAVHNTAIRFNLGISNGFAISKRFDTVSETAFVTHEEKWGDRIYEQGFIAGTAIDYKNYSIVVRYESSNGMSDYSNLKSTVSRFYFLLGYTF